MFNIIKTTGPPGGGHGAPGPAGPKGPRGMQFNNLFYKFIIPDATYNRVLYYCMQKVIADRPDQKD